MELTGKVALITGGGTGLGRAITLALARQGVHVAINYSRSREEAEATAQEAASLGVRAMAVQANVADPDAVERMVQSVERDLGRLDILVANAGTTHFVPFHDLDAITPAIWDEIMAVNVRGTWLCARAAAPAMRRAGGGRIVTVSSIAGLQPQGSSLPYCVSKAAVIHLTRCLAVALAPDILVNGVAPGLLDTRWSAGWGEAGKQAYAGRALTRRLPTLDDVADQVVAFCRTDSTTGQTVAIDGGTVFMR